LAAIFFLSVLTNCSAAESTKAEAEAAVQEAEAKVIECYIAVAEAQKIGADVTDLVGTLNAAGRILSKAHLSYEEGKFDLAVSYSQECVSMLSDFVSHADALTEEAARKANLDFAVNVIGSSSGAIAIVLISFAVWKYYTKREEVKEVA